MPAPTPLATARATSTRGDRLTTLSAGQQIPYGGDRVAVVDADLATRFVPGDRLVVVQSTGALLRIPAAVHDLVGSTVATAVEAFGEFGACRDAQITAFFDAFATRLADDATFAPVAVANAADVERAHAAGRSTTRLALSESMRSDMIDGLRSWRDSPGRRDERLGRIEHTGWTVEQRRAPLGVVGFVFEGRPNVVADACGVLRTGNAVVFRVGSDALGSATAIVESAVVPALAEAGLPRGVVGLIESAERSAGHALFDHRGLALAVARGSGAAVAELGAVAAQAGTPVSLHGTGGAWMFAGDAADHDVLRRAVVNSLDRKVCNTLNTFVAYGRDPGTVVATFLDALDEAAARRSTVARLHVAGGAAEHVPADRFDRSVTVRRADGEVLEAAATPLALEAIGTEWEWEDAPEVTLVVAETLAEAASLCNRHSPRFVVSLISSDPDEHDACYRMVDAPFVGNGFTRWVDGQYALGTPELGLSNWQHGRGLGRGAILSGDSVYTVRHRVVVDDHTTSR